MLKFENEFMTPMVRVGNRFFELTHIALNSEEANAYCLAHPGDSVISTGYIDPPTTPVIFIARDKGEVLQTAISEELEEAKRAIAHLSALATKGDDEPSSRFTIHVHHCPNCEREWDCVDQDCQNQRSYPCNECYVPDGGFEAFCQEESEL